jgi:sirohydrochlorin ferrochelatase
VSDEPVGDQPSTTVVVAAHGSRAEPANAAHREVVEALAADVDVTVTPAFLELAEPSIGDAIDAAVAGGAARVLVLPYFLHPGRHLLEDIPAIVDDAAARHDDVEVAMLGSFGSEPALAEVLSAQVTSALDRS